MFHRTAIPVLFAVALTARGAHAQSQNVLKLTDCRISIKDRLALSSERTGIIEDVAVQEGDFVESGAVVFKLRNRIARAAYEKSLRELANDVDVRYARKASELAQLEYAKSVKLNEVAAGVLTELDLRKLKLAAERSLLQLEQAEHRQELLRLDCQEQQAILASYSVATQMGGMVTKVSKRPGEAVREGETVVEIVNTGRLRVEGYVPLEQSFHIAVGQSAVTYPKLPQSDSSVEQVGFPCRIVFIEPKVEPVTQRVRIVAEVLNEENLLRDGLQATLVIQPTTVRQARFTNGD